MAYQAGVKIAFGTDSGVSPWRKQEFSLMLKGGMPKEAIMSATIYAADLLGEKENLGSIVKDKYADLIGVSEILWRIYNNS